MARLPNPFNPMEVDPDSGAQGMPISGPNGYLVRILDSSWVPVSDNPQLGRLVFQLEVLEGEYAGFKGSYGFNLGHSNAQTVEIAQRELSALCHVCGVFNVVTDTAVLNGKQFRACVRQQKKNPEYTEVWKVLDIHGRSAIDIKKAGPQAMAPQQSYPTAAPPPQAAPQAAPQMAPPPAMPQYAPAAAPPPAAAPVMPQAAPQTAPPAAAPAAPGVPPMGPPAFPQAAPAPASAPAPAAPAPAFAPPPATPAMAPGYGQPGAAPWEGGQS